ncbi:MAG TPA: CoA-transferase, partial [Anaerolineales bacterium]|nr:CoA-transferase [Anaerolineales bacterium]
MTTYTTAELMVTRAAKEIGDGEVVFVGTGLPMIAAMLAKRTHAPHSVIVFEAGTVDSALLHLPASVGDSRCVYGASTCGGLFDVFALLLQRGFIDVGFLGGAQVDRYGNLNSTVIGDYLQPQVRLPGSGGAGDIACLSKRTVVIMRHERRRFVERVDYRTSPGWVDGPGGRERAGLGRGGPAAVITNMAVLQFDEVSRQMVLASHHPGVSLEDIRANTGFPLETAGATETEPPLAAEIRLLHEAIDPEGL